MSIKLILRHISSEYDENKKKVIVTYEAEKKDKTSEPKKESNSNPRRQDFI